MGHASMEAMLVNQSAVYNRNWCVHRLNATSVVQSHARVNQNVVPN